MKTVVLSLVLGIVAVSAACARSPATGAWETYARLRVSGDVAGSEAFVARLRSHGPAVLEELSAERAGLVAARDAITDDDAARLAAEQRLAELDRFIDLVGGQRYCTVSRLFWHTDLTSAQEAARKSGKPILSLRMLGKLTDELSCANSRFFRTTLYANEEISRLLREQFILHWETVRPVPMLTVDYGDGRKLVRTVTGNSVHYVLDAEGRPLDALPGLYGPAAFRDWLLRAEQLQQACAAAPSETDRATLLTDYHQKRLQAVQAEWSGDLAAIGVESASAFAPPAAETARNAQEVPMAVPATTRAVPKAVVEIKPVRMITMSRDDLQQATTDERWRAIAALHADEAALDDASRRLIMTENPTAVAAAAVAETKRRVEMSAIARIFANLQSSVAIDTVRNEYELHTQIHQWYLNGDVGPDITDLNRRVYADLFLMPDSDPWLGLGAPDAYTGIRNAGVVAAE